MSKNNELDLLLGESARLPEQHSQRTPECPPLSTYIRCAKTDWPEELLAHARSCAYCQKSREATWSMECPGLNVLQAYLRDPNYEDRIAVEWHLEWAGCDACEARLELLQEPGMHEDLAGDWHSLIWDAVAEVPTAIADARPKIHITEQLNTLPLTLTAEEKDGSLVVQVTTTDPSLARKKIDLRLVGGRFETRCELRLERVSEEKWHAATTIPSSEERLRDLSNKRLISIRVQEELDLTHGESPSPISAHGRSEQGTGSETELQHLDIPQEIRNAARLLAKSTSEFFATLIGFSSMPAVVPAAAGTLVLSAELDRYRGGTVSLDLDSSGHGVLRSWFDYPESITVSLLDTTNGTLVPLNTDDTKGLPRLSLSAGNSLRNVGVACSPQAFRALRIIVQKSESET